MKRLQQQWFLLALTVLVGLGFGWSSELAFLTQQGQWRSALVGGVMFLMALPLPLETFVGVLRRPQAAILASLINLGVAPLMAWPFIGILGGSLGGGLAVALAAPCTLASAAVWTRRAGGNDVTALMVTVATNLACVVVTPFWLWLMTRQLVGQFSWADQVQKLSLLVLLPIGLAQVARRWDGLARLATRWKTPLGVGSQFGVLVIVFVGTIQSGLAWRAGQGETAWQWAALLGLVFSIHLGLFWGGFWLAGLWRMDTPNRRAVAISGSQKTFMVGAELGLTLGLSILPLLVYHLLQLFIDAIFADRFRSQDQERIVSPAAKR